MAHEQEKKLAKAKPEADSKEKKEKEREREEKEAQEKDIDWVAVVLCCIGTIAVVMSEVLRQKGSALNLQIPSSSVTSTVPRYFHSTLVPWSAKMCLIWHWSDRRHTNGLRAQARSENIG
ncbi:hypothetical protein EDD18DRAFT_1106730 [Armillaria luteobubalina]|uniref:Uncharacterized protein n=1 Tax=Armillaria luteobubalina TaxID=153913 RepID=A0AA39UMZ3_9AGAR|nr:hypothetical protein EDD18DRAFT_1112841 [Armillaria luteobubalina]KAK0494863.1 hypothetical protein EDD18DRAFT_1106730 [Armillaria luteobubalina]